MEWPKSLRFSVQCYRKTRVNFLANPVFSHFVTFFFLLFKTKKKKKTTQPPHSSHDMFNLGLSLFPCNLDHPDSLRAPHVPGHGLHSRFHPLCHAISRASLPDLREHNLSVAEMELEPKSPWTTGSQQYLSPHIGGPLWFERMSSLNIYQRKAEFTNYNLLGEKQMKSGHVLWSTTEHCSPFRQMEKFKIV